MAALLTDTDASAPDLAVARRALAWQRVALALLLALFIVLPHFVFPMVLMKLICYALFAVGFNLLFGYVGLLSFGHAAFFGGAAYATACATKFAGLSPEVSILLGVAFSIVLGALFGALAIRRKGIYFSMVTLALAQMFYFFCLQVPFTGGDDGIQGISRGRLFGVISLADDLSIYYVVLALFIAGSFIAWRIIHSPFGVIMKAVRDDEKRMTSLGYRVDRYKLAAFVMSAGITGLAGAMKVLVFQFATPSDVNWHMSGDAILMTLLGGVATTFGPMAGSAIYVWLQNFVATAGLPGSIVSGLTFVVCILILKRGVVGESAHLWASWKAARARRSA